MMKMKDARCESNHRYPPQLSIHHQTRDGPVSALDASVVYVSLENEVGWLKRRTLIAKDLLKADEQGRGRW
jgi:hypothetical protein